MASNDDIDLDAIRVILTNPKTPYRLLTCPDPTLTSRQQKQLAALEVTKLFCEAKEAFESRRIFKSIEIREDDPPDAMVEELDGNRTGVEVTELLNKETQSRRVKVWRKYRDWGEAKRWEPEELINESQKRIKEKNAHGKPEFNGGPYVCKILVIYSVETSVQIHFRNLAFAISQKEFGPAPRFDEIYFLTVPAPMQEHPQLCKLRLKNE